MKLFCLSDFAANWALSWEKAAVTKGIHWNVCIWMVSILFSAFYCVCCYLMYRVFLHRPDGSPCTQNMVVLCSNGLISLGKMTNLTNKNILNGASLCGTNYVL